MSLFLLVGCASEPKTESATVMPGMSRDDLKFYFGKPLRVEPAASGGEDWYYRFSSWNAQPTRTSGVSVESGQLTSYVSENLDVSRQVVELPVHVSAEGFVIGPVPEGKVVKR